MKYLGWFCAIVFGIFTFSYIYYKGRENEVVDGFVQKIETIEEPGTKQVFITINGLAKNGCSYDRRIEFEGPDMPVIGQEVYIQKPKELRLRVVVKKTIDGAILDKDGWPREEKRE